MRQLTSIDAQFLAIEDGRTHGHVAAVGIYDPSTAPAGQLTRETVRDLVAARLHLLPPFHWRLVARTVLGQLEVLDRGLAGAPRQRMRSLRRLPRALAHLDPTMRTLPGIASVAALGRRASRPWPRTTDGGAVEGRGLYAPRTS